MNKPVPIQLAIQGGGAKLIALLGALEAVAELEKQGELRVTRIAATSAGAIAGALFAAPIDLSLVRAHLEAHAASLIRAYQPPTLIRKSFAALRNAPLWDVTHLKRCLSILFETRRTLGDLKKPLAIIAADLKNLSKVVRDKETDPLLDSILDSCAIPLFFRTVGADADSSALIVDGGLCANLPSEVLTTSEEDGEILGISFATVLVPANPTGLVSFAEAMLNTAVEHSVLRARETIGSDRLLSLQTRIDTFDFAFALTEGLKTEWKLCYTQAKDFFSDYVARAVARERLQQQEEAARARMAAEEAERAARDAERQKQLQDTLRKVRRTIRTVYELQETPTTFEYERVSMIVTGYSLVSDTRHDPDTVVRHSEFRAANGSIRARLASTLTDITEQPVSDDFRVIDKDGNAVDIERLDLEPENIIVDDTSAILYRKIIYFRTPLEVGDPRAPFKLQTFEKYTGALAKLRQKREDWISVKVSRVSGIVPIVDIVLHLPDSYKGTKLMSGGMRDENNEWVQFHPGEEIRTNVLNKEYPPPPGFFALGWRGKNLPDGTRFGCKIYPSKGVTS